MISMSKLTLSIRSKITYSPHTQGKRGREGGREREREGERKGERERENQYFIEYLHDLYVVMQ